MQQSRRMFLQGACAAVSLAALSQALPGGAFAATRPAAVSLEHCVTMTPKAMAESSSMVQRSWGYLQEQIASIRNGAVRVMVQDVYEDSMPRIPVTDAKVRRAVGEELVAKGYSALPADTVLPQLSVKAADMQRLFPAIAAPGSGYGSHHAYPGGLMTHVAANVHLTDSLVKTYTDVYGYDVDRDTALAAQLLHDLHKPFVFQWLDDYSSRTEQRLAGTGEHHVLSIAEMMVRKAPADLVVAQACAHTHPGTQQDEEQVVNWLKAAAIIAGVNPVSYGVLAADGKTIPLPRRQEGFLCHIGDHDFVLSVPVVQWTLPVLKELAATEYGMREQDLNGRPFHALRNYVYSQYSAMALENVYVHEGKEGMHRVVRSLVTA